MPVMSAGVTWQADVLTVEDTCVLRFNGPARLHVHTGRPRHIRIGFCRQQFPRDAIQYVEKAVFRRLHENFAFLSVNFEIRENHMLSGGIIPGLTRRGLVVPHVFTGTRPQCHDRGQEQIVTTPRAAQLLIPG